MQPACIANLVHASECMSCYCIPSPPPPQKKDTQHPPAPPALDAHPQQQALPAALITQLTQVGQRILGEAYGRGRGGNACACLTHGGQLMRWNQDAQRSPYKCGSEYTSCFSPNPAPPGYGLHTQDHTSPWSNPHTPSAVALWANTNTRCLDRLMPAARCNLLLGACGIMALQRPLVDANVPFPAAGWA